MSSRRSGSEPRWLSYWRAVESGAIRPNGGFAAGSALAGLGGVMWGLYQQNVTPQIGAQVNVLIFIVIIMGGLGSTGGALIGALLVGLMANYTGYLVPKLAGIGSY